MDPGRLDRRVTIKREIWTPRPDGGFDTVMVVVVTVWAHVHQTSGGEFVKADMVTAERRAVFTMHHRSDLTTADVLEWDGVAWNVRALRELGRREAIEIHATSE
ncbi:phage head closure protein [Roseospira visakhapatnamensis]|uniref:SPP1 family predicted phage head-tail adaptor n=1 Tax=Roseospira visakhapatnamensis TaxID=390880 RepID=A0A7W6RAA8_9PROT|nr:phage head closure protein [Roseospira visakhapatnamensis]MBB4264804.1 SPP1 family predicted phage head-tail adaptor [Roseospira visakhapatnamensis]